MREVSNEGNKELVFFDYEERIRLNVDPLIPEYEEKK